MKDQQKQLEVFCAFVIDYNKINNTVTEMIESGEEADLKKVERMYSYVADFIENASSTDDILMHLNNAEVDERLKKLIAYLNIMLSKDKEASFAKLNNNFNELDHILEVHHIKRNINSVFDEDLIDKDPTIPIAEEDLSFLNNIAKLSMENYKEMLEAEKNFKTPIYRNKIKDLYHINAFYFEQVFSNADTKIQKKILHIIQDHQANTKPTEEEIETLKDLEDINILSDIDSLALKSKSNMSDHQAFDAFCKILRKNTNLKLINKVLRENIIMTSMFKTNSTTIGENYGLRKMFISARYPLNQRIVIRYMQLLEKNESDIAIIFKGLRKDMEFNKSYDSYIKSKDTVEFKSFLGDLMKKIEENDLSEGNLETLAFVVESFTYMDKHDTDILSMEEINEIMKHIYQFSLKNELFKKDIRLNVQIMEYQKERIRSYLQERIDMFHMEDKAVEYGIAPTDVWYFISRLIVDRKLDHINRFYLKYNEINGYVINKSQPLKFIGEEVSKVAPGDMKKDECLIIGADIDNKNLEIFLFSLCGRIVKCIYNGTYDIKVKSVETAMFRKKVTPGFEKAVELAIKKAYMTLLTFSALYYLDQNLFAQIYRNKVEKFLADLSAVEVSEKEAEEFIQMKDINTGAFCDKKSIGALKKSLSGFNFKTDNIEFVKHGEELFALFFQTDL